SRMGSWLRRASHWRASRFTGYLSSIRPELAPQRRTMPPDAFEAFKIPTANGSLVRNGEVYDGSGGPPRRVDLRIGGGLIQEIGPNLASQGEDVIDAAGLIVAP